jgi:hypothetical protein
MPDLSRGQERISELIFSSEDSFIFALFESVFPVVQLDSEMVLFSIWSAPFPFTDNAGENFAAQVTPP